VEVLNLGVPAHGPRDTLRVLRRLGLATGPDIVLHHFFVGNDFWDNRPGTEQVALNGIPIPVRRPGWLGGYPEWKWYTLQYAAILRTVGRKDVRAAPHGPQRLPEDLYLADQRGALQMYLRKDMGNPGKLSQLAYVRSLLVEIARVSRGAGAAFFLVVIPQRLQVDPALRGQLVDRFRLDEADYDFDFPSRFFARLGEEEGLRIVDLTSLFRQHAAAEGLYLPLDHHLTEEGHRLVAGALAGVLRARGTRRTEARP
jgi:hypothetical protein